MFRRVMSIARRKVTGTWFSVAAIRIACVLGGPHAEPPLGILRDRELGRAVLLRVVVLHDRRGRRWLRKWDIMRKMNGGSR